MGKYKEQFKNLIMESSDLNMNQKRLWDIFISKASEDEEEAVFEAVSESPDNLTLLTNYLKEKILQMR